MPRTERKKSKTSKYHVLIRGINKQRIFEEPEDYKRFLAIISDVKKLSGFKLYAYCLMGNHIHMLIEEGEEPISNVFRRIGSRYVFWYNWKYGRNGHLFQDRFRSEPVETDEYFITVLLYIYQNPVKAGICKRTIDYEWSSRSLSEKNGLIDEAELYSITSKKDIEKLERIEIEGGILEPRIGRRQAISDEAAVEQMKRLSETKSATEFQSMGREDQIRVFAELRKHGVSIRQLARLSGLGKGVCECLCRAGRDA